MRRKTRNKVNALLAQIEHHIREEVETELTEKFTTPRKKPGPKPGTKRKTSSARKAPKIITFTDTESSPAAAHSAREPRKKRVVRAPLIDWTPRKQNRPRTLPLAPDPPELSMYD